MKKHLITGILPGSIAEEMDIKAGDYLVSINNTEIEDIFDYRYLIQNEYIEILIEKENKEEWVLEVDKDYDEDLGLDFKSGLMDEYRSCMNKCIFCFIDQMPKGMRSTLYFKDDDSRLSFLQGNYVTLTNMSEHDIDRIIKYRLEPINISFQTTDPLLRCKMTGNRFAGEALKKAKRLYDAGITMNGQIVLCKGINDGENLKRSLSDLLEYVPVLESVSIVPVGITKFREELFPLESFTKDDAAKVINIVEDYQQKAMKISDMHFVHASDEFYLLAGREMPKEDTYDGYLQLENGVGMIRLLINESEEALRDLAAGLKSVNLRSYSRKITIATGYLAYPFIKEIAEKTEKILQGLSCRVIPIRNDFFGEKITVAGLITGQDLIAQLKGNLNGEELLIPECMLRADDPVFLDDVTVADLENALQVKLRIVKSNGDCLVKSIVGDML